MAARIEQSARDRRFEVKYLLDTPALLWARSTPDILSSDALAVFKDPECLLFVSVASLWECAIKCSVGKLVLPNEFYQIVDKDYRIMEINLAHLEAYRLLPMIHKDPFDRMLIVQAQLGDLTLVTRDENIRRYDVAVLNA